MIASLATGGFRFGAGVAVHFSPSFECNFVGQCSGGLTLDDAIGATLQIAYHLADERGFDLGVRGTYIHYERMGQLKTYDGSCLGFFVGVWL